VLGPHCRVGPHVHWTGHLVAGADNVFHAGCVIGDAPQDLKYKGEPTRLRIGDHNVFREHVTVHRSNNTALDTVIGSNNFLMHHCHVAHNCKLGDHIIIANGALLAGHVEVGDRAFISGNCLLHQCVRVGTLAMMQGKAGIGMDLPPYTVAYAENLLCGLNTIGLRRAGIGSAERLELKKLYRLLFRDGLNLRAALAKAQTEFSSAPARVMIDFIASAKRGVCSDVGSSREEPT